MKISEKIALTKKLIEMVKEDSSNVVCGDINLNCSNCQMQMLVGLLNEYLDNLEFDK